MSLQKRWVCGQSPEQRFWGLRFDSRLPVGLYTTHLERGFLFSVLQFFSTVLSGGIHCVPCTKSSSPCSKLSDLEPSRTSWGGSNWDNHHVNLEKEDLVKARSRFCLSRYVCAQDAHLVTPPCSKALLPAAIGLGKSSQGLGHKVHSWGSEMLVQPLSCSAHSKVWQQLGQSFTFSLLWELFQFSSLTALSRGMLGDMKGLNPLTKPGKRDLGRIFPTQSAWTVGLAFLSVILRTPELTKHCFHGHQSHCVRWRHKHLLFLLCSAHTFQAQLPCEPVVTRAAEFVITLGSRTPAGSPCDQQSGFNPHLWSQQDTPHMPISL